MKAMAFPEARAEEARSADEPRISVVIITRDRPEHLRRCLANLATQTRAPEEVIVVDSSDSSDSEAVAAAFSGARYFRFPAGRRGMPAARNFGIRKAQGDVVAFLDDDCQASPVWLEKLAAAYADREVDGAGGKVIDPVVTLGPVRRFLESGEPWAEPDDGGISSAEVDFLQGGNMSFRRDALIASGGFDTAYTGTNFREETDLCFRLRSRGHRLLYVPPAVVVHLRAPRSDGAGRHPEDLRREFYHARNQTYFVLKNYGLAFRPLAFYLGWQTLERVFVAMGRPSTNRLLWLVAHLLGKGLGVLVALRHRLLLAGRREGLLCV